MPTDHPLPGDLVIREEKPHPGIAPLFVITLHPNRTLSGEPYSDLKAAIEHARLVTLKRGGRLQVWREIHSATRGYENLSLK